MGILLKLNPTLEQQYRQLAMKKFGYSKGALSKALNEAVRLWIQQETDSTAFQTDTIQGRIMAKLRSLLPELRRNYKVSEIGIFGSYATHRQTPQSDLDILVSFKESPGLLRFVELKDLLSHELGIKVDLVVKKALKPEIKQQILEDAIYA
jgi:hypothetical protein